MSHHHDHEPGWPGSLVESTQEPRNDQTRTESRGSDKNEPGGQQMPEDGDWTLFLGFEDGLPTLAIEQWVNCKYDHDRPHWPLWQRAEAEATVERVKKAIGGWE
jgi:hypothetical protein